MATLDSFKSCTSLSVGDKSYTMYSLLDAEKNGLPDVSRLPFAMKVLLENLLRYEDGRTVTKADIEAVAAWIDNKGKAEKEIAFRPARVLMQDFTGVPAVVDLAAMRDAMKNLGGDPRKINPLVPVDLVIDHSVIVDEFGTPQAFAKNVEIEYRRNAERYRFLKWGQTAFNNFSVVPPGTGICHQVNLEFLSQTVWSRKTEAEPTRIRLSGHARRHRLAHDDGQRPRGARLGRRRHRGRGGDARPADLDADPRGRRLQADRPPARGRHRDRSRADGHADAAQEGRRRQVRRVLRHRPRRHDGRRPRHHRQHGAGIRRDLRLLPDRRADDRVPARHRPDRRPRRARRGLCQGAGDVPDRGHAGPGVHRHARAEPRRGAAVARRPEAPPGPGHACRHEGRLHQGDGHRVPQRRARSGSASRSRARTSTSAMATSSSRRSRHAPTPRTRAS